MRHGYSLLTIAMLALAACGPEPLPREGSHAIPVRTEKVERAGFQPRLTLLGTVRPSASVDVPVHADGILRYPARFQGGLATGVRVEKGEVLAFVENPSLELRLDEAKLQTRATQAELERHRRSMELGLESAAELAHYETEAALALEREEAAEQEAARVRLKAPASGTLIVEKVHLEGSEIASGTLLATLAAEGRPVVEAWAAAADRRKLRPGLEADLRQGTEIVGQAVLREVASVVDEAGTVRLVAELLAENEYGEHPIPGEGVELDVRLPVRQQVLTVPEEALVVSAGGNAVYVVEPSRFGARALRQPVTLGGRGEHRVEVLDGIQEGARVVVAGVGFLTSGAQVIETEGAETDSTR